MGFDNDCKIALDIYGQDIASLKGKSTRPKSLAVVDAVIPMPKRLMHIHKHVHLCIDVMCMSNLLFLVSRLRMVLIMQIMLRHLYEAA